VPKASEGEQYLQHALREPSPCNKCQKRKECATQEMACERFYRYVRKEPFKKISTVASGYWYVLLEKE